jgi:hypothetical protein
VDEKLTALLVLESATRTAKTNKSFMIRVLSRGLDFLAEMIRRFVGFGRIYDAPRMTLVCLLFYARVFTAQVRDPRYG